MQKVSRLRSCAIGGSEAGFQAYTQRSVAGKPIKGAENGPVDYAREENNQRCSTAVVQRHQAYMNDLSSNFMIF
jgi:hypothetical protein